MAQEGLINIRSNRAAADIVNRLDAALVAKGITLFARVDHASGAAEVGLKLRPTTVLIFGNAKAGTPLMQAEQTIGIDLPLKILVWEDAAGTAWLTYNDPAWLARRHGIDPATQPTVGAMATLLAALAHDAGAE